MNGAGPADHTAREIARGLVEVLDAALEPSSPPLAVSAAREVARLLDLPGLERVLALAEMHGARRPAELAHVLERVRRLHAQVRASEAVGPFATADAELAALAATLAEQHWAEPAPSAGAPVAAIGVDDALPGFALAGLADPAPRVTAPVAAALRAAFDWLAADPEAPVPTETHDDFLVLEVDVIQPDGLSGTGDVLGGVGGHLAPVRPGARRWRIVVPRLVPRPSYLLLEQGRLGLAVPWHAVIRLRMLSAERAQDEAPVLPPLRWGASLAGERPAALVGHGLRRAWLMADRVVWRMAANTDEPDVNSPVPGLTTAVCGESGELFWVAQPGWLLRATPAVEPEWQPEPEPVPVEDPPAESLAAIETPEPSPAPEWDVEAAEPGPVEWLVRTTPPAESPAVDAPPPVRVTYAPPTLTLLRPEDVEPLGDFGDEGPEWEAAPADQPCLEALLDAPEVPTVLEPPVMPADAVEPLAGPDPVPTDESPAPDSLDAAGPAAWAAPADAPLAPEAGEAAAPAAPATDVPVAEPPGPVEITSRLALVAEDSLVASIFLQRLLEQRGFRSVTVEMASDLERELARGGWGLVLVDVRLPDATGTEHLRTALRAAAATGGTAVVALSRDPDDEKLALEAGVVHHLRKPFEALPMERLFARLGIPLRGARA